MKSVVTAAVAALLVGGMSLGVLNSAFAQDPAPDANASAAAQPSPPSSNAGPGHWLYRHPGMGGPGRRQGPGGMGMMGMGRGGLLALACGDRGAEALEIALVRIYYRVKPNDEQQPLFDALKTAALADQKTFAKSCQDAMGKARGQQQNPLDRLQDRLALAQAEVTALDDIVPKFKAFYDSLTPDQQSKLERPQHRWIMRGMHRSWQQPGGPMQHPGPMQGPGAMHGQDMQPDASPTPSTDPDGSAT